MLLDSNQNSRRGSTGSASPIEKNDNIFIIGLRSKKGNSNLNNLGDHLSIGMLDIGIQLNELHPPAKYSISCTSLSSLTSYFLILLFIMSLKYAYVYVD